MKLTAIVLRATALFASSPVLACMRVRGSINQANGAVWGEIDDNGGTGQCVGGARIDQDNHYSIYCPVPTYVYAFTQDGKTAW
jgi:hypothetical protein